MGTLAFRNLAQKVLFELELAGQLSDGYWENSLPHDHWQPWCDAKVVVDPNNLGKDFYPRKESYMFNAKDLLEVVGERMIGKVRVALALGEDVAQNLQWMIEGTGPIKLPEESATGYYGDKRKKLLDVGIDKINDALTKGTYSMKDMQRDLKDMKKIIKMRRRHSV